MRLFWAKYSSQVALGEEPLQKRPQSLVVPVPLVVVWTLAQTSKPRLDNVRFPSRQTLEQERGVRRPATPMLNDFRHFLQSPGGGVCGPPSVASNTLRLA